MWQQEDCVYLVNMVTLVTSQCQLLRTLFHLLHIYLLLALPFNDLCCLFLAPMFPITQFLKHCLTLFFCNHLVTITVLDTVLSTLRFISAAWHILT